MQARLNTNDWYEFDSVCAYILTNVSSMLNEAGSVTVSIETGFAEEKRQAVIVCGCQ